MIKPLILGTMLAWGGYEYVTYSIDKTTELESQVDKLQETISDLRERNDAGTPQELVKKQNSNIIRKTLNALHVTYSLKLELKEQWANMQWLK